ncbi:hypothetical protein [Bizionia argentinensis]|uniref:hypothetical protein n=1 Tax=Bizionia argentinensis TaxID=456455 RepID=UPI00022305F8|nr:hypothetical protein [Bizionia argentinensis]
MKLFKTLQNHMKPKHQKSIDLLEDSLNSTKNSTNITTKVERVKSFQDYALQKAGLNNGDATSLKTHLRCIKDGYVVDETYNENEHQIRRKQIVGKIELKQDEKESIEGAKRNIESVEIPSRKEKIKDFDSEIQQTKLDLEANKINTGYQAIKHYTYMTLVMLLSVYLILFYASAIYASFFRNASTLIELAGDDIALYLDSIFDIKGIFTPSYSLIIVYLGAFLFFAIGMIPHTMEGKYKKLKAGLAILGSLVVDALLAYKIDKGIHDLKVMAGIAEEDWNFLTSINFYLVLAFGFLAYLVWGYMFELMIKEKDKKNAHISAELLIKGLKKSIREERQHINSLETKVIELESQLAVLKSQIEHLKKDLDRAMLNPDLLSQSLTSFYMGWLQYLNGSIELNAKKEACTNAYDGFMETHFKITPSFN